MPQNIEAIVQRMIDAGESEENIATVIRASKTQSANAPLASDAAPLAGTAALASAPVASNLVMRFATNPALPQTVGAASRAATTLGMLWNGVSRGSLAEVVAASPAGWQAGQGGYWLGQNAQKVALPISKGLEAAAPYASALSGAAGVGELAQMAEPARKDIGFLGVGPSVDVPGAHPPIINDLIARIRARFGGGR